MKNFIFDIQRFDDWATIISSDSISTVDESVSTANGTDYAETIQSEPIDSTLRAIYANGGNDTVSIYGSSYGVEFSTLTVDGGSGDNSINIYGGVDAIHPSTVSISGGIGDDIIDIYGNNEGIHGGISEDVDNKTTATINGSDGNDKIIIRADKDKGIDISKVTITGGIGKDLISIFGGNYGIGGWEDTGGSTVSVDGGDGADTISVSSIDSISGGNVTITAGAGDIISVGSGGANYLFDSTDAVTINGATFTSNAANTSASIESSADSTSIKSDWSGTVALSGNNSLADIDGSIVSAAGNYQIVDGKFTSYDTVTPADTSTDTNTVIGGKKLDIVFLIDNTGSMNEYISSVKSAVGDFASNLQNSGLNCRYGLVEFGDNVDSSINIYDFTNDVDNFVANVNNISLTKGDDRPESGLEAIINGALTMNFDENAEKRFIVITDASFHNQGESGSGDSSSYLVTTDISQALNDNDVTMDVVGNEDFEVSVEGYGVISDNCQTEWEPLANATGGKFYLLGEGFPSIFSKIVIDIVNVVDLNLVPENQTGYFVATQNSDTYTTPIFQTDGTSSNDTTVGAVNSINLYVADTDTDRQQTIIITDGWNATATKNDDNLMITGVSATVTGGDGADVFSLGTDTRTVALMDLNIDEDKLSFGNYITPGTMSQTIEDNHLVLTADNLRVDLPGMSEMTEEFLDYSVGNAGSSSTIRELLYGVSVSADSFISFSHWTFGFDSSTGF